MNTPRRLAVHAATAAAVIIASASLWACDDAAGGAVDLSWTIRTTQASDIDCASAQVDRIALHWQVKNIDGNLGDEGSRSWPCENVRAITGFEVPVGQALLWVVPTCADGNPATAATFETPAPLQRTIETGEAISLGAVVVSVQTTSCDEQMCICR